MFTNLQRKKTMSKAKKDKKRQHRIAFSISDRDYELLKLYASTKKTTKGHLAKQILRHELKQFKSTLGDQPIKNQLNLFISHQTDIFDIIEEKI